jgi:hypothetical protein
MAERMQRKLTFAGKIKDFDADDQALEYWLAQPYAKKLAEIWSLTLTAYELKGQRVSSRLRRPLRITKRKRR